MAELFTDQSVYFHTPNTDEIITQWSLPKRLINFSIKLTVQPVITYICVGKFMHPVYLIFQTVLLK
jgi:hypothetical protein